MNTQIKFSENPYQYIRAIRLRGEIQDPKEEFISKLPKTKVELSLNELVTALKEVYSKCQNLIFYEDKKSKNKAITNEISVNKLWLKRWHKQEFYALSQGKKQKSGKYKLRDASFIKEGLDDWSQTWNEYTTQIIHAIDQPSDSSTSRSDIAYYIRQLYPMRCAYISHFLKEIHTREVTRDDKIKELKDVVHKAEERLKQVMETYLPAQSDGVEIARASFNYFTVNKKPKALKTQLEDLRTQRACKNYEIITTNQGYKFKKNKDNTDIFVFEKAQEKEWLKGYIEKEKLVFSESKIKLSIDDVIKLMKAFKAEQKAIFYELITHIAHRKTDDYIINNPIFILNGYCFDNIPRNRQDFNQLFSLFRFDAKKEYYKEKYGKNWNKDHWNKDEWNENDWKNFLRLTKTISQRGNKAQRGKYLFGRKCYFAAYSKFCETYKRIAMERGKLIAQEKGIENEQLEADKTQYWAMVYDDGKGRKLCLIPREKIQDAKRYVEQLQECTSETKSGIYLFQSLTLRALHKLCFAEESTFVANMPPDLKRKQNAYKQYKSRTENDPIKKERELDCLKAVILSNYAKKSLQLESFDLNHLKHVESKEKFEETLENICYVVHKKTVSDFDAFVEKYNITVINLNSYDLNNHPKNTYQTPESQDRLQTQWWTEFWNKLGKEESNIRGFHFGKIRLNPEVKMYYRRDDEEIKKCLKEKGFDLKKIRHRRLKPQYMVTFSLSLNAGRRYPELAFAKQENIVKEVNNFNTKLNEEMNFETAWKYGIDRGNIELATLCIAKFTPKDTHKYDGKNILNPTFPNGEEDIEVYELKNLKYKETYTTKSGDERTRQAVLNPSYFIDNEQLFNKKSVTCLDLTTAKVIKGKIVSNGDIMTYLKLKKVSAKRRLYNLYVKKEILKSEKIEWSYYEDENRNDHRRDGVLNIKLQDSKSKTIYWFDKRYDSIVSQDRIKADLNRYLEELRNDNHEHTESIEKINHLRSAITANMVGVICFLQQPYPGFIILEDLVQKDIDKHFTTHNENISRYLENALYNKFQSLGLVPPHVKDMIQLREKNKTKGKATQVGSIIFVDEAGTSTECPYCENKMKWPSIEAELKFSQHRFCCGEQDPCGYDTYLFKTDTPVNSNINPPISTSNKEYFELYNDIDDPDKVAAYNISKKIKKTEDIQPFNTIEESKENLVKKTSSNDRKKMIDKKPKRPTSSGHNPFEKFKDLLNKK